MIFLQYHFWVFRMTRPGIKHRSPKPLDNTLLIIPMAGQWVSQSGSVSQMESAVSRIDTQARGLAAHVDILETYVWH